MLGLFVSKTFQLLQSTFQDCHIKTSGFATENCFRSGFLSAQHIYRKPVIFSAPSRKRNGLLHKLSMLCHFDR